MNEIPEDKKIGQRFYVDGQLLEAVESDGCCHSKGEGKYCHLFNEDSCLTTVGHCAYSFREDKRNICFIKAKEEKK